MVLRWILRAASANFPSFSFFRIGDNLARPSV
jgi:hypothetical protein